MPTPCTPTLFACAVGHGSHRCLCLHARCDAAGASGATGATAATGGCTGATTRPLPPSDIVVSGNVGLCPGDWHFVVLGLRSEGPQEDGTVRPAQLVLAPVPGSVHGPAVYNFRFVLPDSGVAVRGAHAQHDQPAAARGVARCDT